MNPDDSLLVGRIARAHGNRGQVIVNPETDFPGERFAVGNVVIVQAGGVSTHRRIVSVRFQQGRPIIALEGVETMSEAEALAGADLLMLRSAMGALPAGTFYRDELVGCEVRDTADVVVGRVTGVDGPMDRSHLVVEGVRGEILIPLNAEICVRVDPAAGLIVVDPPEGLLQLNEDRRSQR